MSAPTIEFPCPSAIKGEVMPYVASVAGPPFATGDGLVKTHAESYVAAKIDSAHEEIGEMCQPNFDGTDWERTVEFATKMGLSIEPFYYVRENQAPKLVDVFTRHNAGYSEESAGFLSPSLRMAAVYRRAKNEQMFGTGLKES